MKMQLCLILLVCLAMPVFAANSCTDNLCTYDTAITADETWIDGNTYYVTAATLNVENNATLAIGPGAVVKFKRGIDSYLYITGGGILNIDGNSTNPIVFTSADDNSVGISIGVSDGVPAGGDWWGIWYETDAGMTADANDLHDFNIAFATWGIYNAIQLNSIHDAYFTQISSGGDPGPIWMDEHIGSIYNNAFTSNSGLSVLQTGANSVGEIYNNVFSNNAAIGITFGNETFPSVHDNNFLNNTESPVKLVLGTITNLYKNNFAGNAIASSGYGAAIQMASGTIATISDNNFSNNSVDKNGGAISNGGTLTNIYNNVFENNSAEGGGAISNSTGTITNLENNIFKNNSATVAGGAIHNSKIFLVAYSTINQINNNIFFNNSAGSGGAICNSQSPRAIIEKMQNNIFAYNTGTAVLTENDAPINNPNHNVYWANDTNNSGVTEGGASVYLGATPFIDDGSDRNFLFNSYGIAQLEGDGNSNIGTDSFFQARTVRFDNRLDYNRTPGYHYDQNSPYVSVISPSAGNYAGTVTVDFNVSTSNAAATAITTLLLSYNTTQAPGTTIVSQALSSYTCSGSFPTLTRDVNCTYSWDTSEMTDGNYFVIAQATDANGTGIGSLDNNILLDNTASVTLTVTNVTTTGNTARITFTATSGGSGIKNYWISVDDGLTWSNNGLSA
ncbi:MAG: right-handed parallel beta-helix repeat-containing protein, partial [Candidatus Diapherotrites archaeon]|nr:right-handed parallel beta-helix repeat-containing protein [Candidatus Diapherotrites archaeon]